ncbi:UDP-N-acetylmuramate dehydrogenase [Coralloluteibacterium thermophilus]|uniref:UDP-N-acetylenolpyruvoylglucosamine reductase n=1 Tax=Coralloluteibacterium thermophilum TaxID=2707049 RepID=A0ABV9NM48_9GAMM
MNEATTGAGYRLHHDAPLKDLNTLGVRSRARVLVDLDTLDALPAALADPALHGQVPVVLGAGSNVLIAGDVDAVLRIRADAVRTVAREAAGIRVRAEAGLAWDALVRWTLAQGLPGLENMALIPGTVGAAPIQNIGAYGAEMGDFADVVEAYDLHERRVLRLGRAECAFGYRDSLFKRQPGRWIVLAVEFLLPHDPPLRLDYAGLREELAAMGVGAPTAGDVAEAVTRVRTRKLPDWRVLPNAGSFFKNPMVPVAQAQALAETHPGMPSWPGEDAGTRKLSAAWLIEACGWKGERRGDAGIYAGHALVLVNHGQASGADLLALARAVTDAVAARFGVRLEPEPRILGEPPAP